MFAHVSSEFVRASKLPVAPFPVALVGFFPSVGPLVGFEVRALGVHLAASRVSAPVDALVPLWLGIVVDSIHQFIRTKLGGDATSH